MVLAKLLGNNPVLITHYTYVKLDLWIENLNFCSMLYLTSYIKEVYYNICKYKLVLSLQPILRVEGTMPPQI